jgi:UDP-N-acetylglucosamine diphosphorylase/glucosamine-1-phosphate N-acetyltransferase
MRVCLFEDRGVTDLEPLTLTRPACDLLCGLGSLASKHCRYFQASEVCLLVRPHLADYVRERSPGLAVNDAAWLRAGPVVLVNARWLPPEGSAPDLHEPVVALVGDEAAYAVLDAGRAAACLPEAIDYCESAWKALLPHRDAGGRLVRHLWELVAVNGEQIIRDYEALPFRRLPAPPILPAVVGPRDWLAIDPTAHVEPMVVADTTHGPVVIEQGAFITAFTRLEGPCVVGRGTHVLGANVRGGTTIGSNCRIGGEVEASIVQGHTNKYHDGFLGHAYLGEWINLGAGTINSDLRNDYREVKVVVNGRLVATGQTKVGCFLGDHTRTGIGTLFNTGTTTGAFAHLLPGGLLPRAIPSFTACRADRLADRGDLDAILRTAAVVMRRRGRELTLALDTLYRTLHDETAAQRDFVLRERETRPLRRSA